jgi:hypothetical protein
MHILPLIQAVTVNHNTSPYAELMLRSLFAKHPAMNIKITVMDNSSTDDMANLRAYAAEQDIPIVQSGYAAADTKLNSHGEILARFVLEHPHCDYYLFLDTDVVFIHPNTINLLMDALASDLAAFGAGPMQSWDGDQEIPAQYHELIYERRLHPCCALIKNTPLFRRVVEIIGLTGVRYCWSKRDDMYQTECEDYADTFELMTRVMKTHDQKHIIVPPMILHFFSVSYDPLGMEHKNRNCQAMLTVYRTQS